MRFGKKNRARCKKKPSPLPALRHGKAGRRSYIKDRYKELDQESDSHGKRVYTSQQKIIEKLVTELEVSVRTIKGDITHLRRNHDLPTLVRRRRRQLTNRMHHINPTRAANSAD